MSARELNVLLTVDAVGGVWTYALDLARTLAPLGVRTTLALMGPPPTEAQRAAARACPAATLIETGLALDWLAEDAGTVAEAGRRIAELAGDIRSDVVQLNMAALAAGTAFTAPVIAVAHSCVTTWWQAVEGQGALPDDLAWRGALTAAGLRQADVVVAPSRAFAEATQRAHGLAACPHVVHNGRAPLPFAHTAMHDFVLTAGRLWDRSKNVATIDRAARRLGIPTKAAGATRGPNGEEIRFEHLHPLGQLDEVALAACLAPRPVFVSTARYEPFGLAVLEAAAAGCALVLSDIPTFRELWDGVAAFVSPDDDAALARAVDAIVGDARQRLTLGEAARRRAARYTPEAMAAGMAALYHDAQGRRMARAAA